MGLSRIVIISSVLFNIQYSIINIQLKAQDEYGKPGAGLATEGSEAELLEDAEWFFGLGEYLKALPFYVKLAQQYPKIEYKFYSGVCYLYKTDEQEKALSLLETVYKKEPDFKNLLFYLGKAHMLNYNFDKASEFFQKALLSSKTSGENRKMIKHLLENCENGNYLFKNYMPGTYEIKNLGKPVNTEYSEYVPLVSPDDALLIFTYKGEGVKGGLQNFYGESDPEGEYYEDIFISRKSGDKWLKPEGIMSGINTNGHDAAIALSPDGQKLFVYKYFKGGDIYVSYLKGNVWTEPVELAGKVNSKSWEGSATLSADGKTLYFSSDRPGGYGGKDIYKATLGGGGDFGYGNVQNLGPNINTPYNDDAPFIHANGKWLFFSSEGHNSMGGYDIFFCTDVNGDWSELENIGHPINTPNDDIFYTVTLNAEKGYLSSGRKGGFGGQDIYAVKPGIAGKKPALAVIKGKFTSNGKNAGATIIVTNTTDDELYGKFQSDEETGSYLLALKPGYDYKIDFEINGELLRSENIDANELTAFAEIKQDFELSAGKTQAIDTNIIQKQLSQKIEEIEKAATGKQQPETRSQEPEADISRTKAVLASDKNMAGPYYKVQVAAYRHPENYNNAHLDDLGKPEALNIDDITRFTIGTFKTLNEAEQFKKLIVRKGVKDAFITLIEDGERKYLHHARGFEYPEPTGKGVVAGKKWTKKSISGYSAPPEEFVYKVQVAAYRNPENYNNENLAGLGEPDTLNIDDITRFTIGTFSTLQEARQFKEKIVSRGCEDAFITAEVNGKRKYLYELSRKERRKEKDELKKKKEMQEAPDAYQKLLQKYGTRSVEGLIFKVQSAAYRYAENYNSSHVDDLGKIEKNKLHDGITRFTIGTFNTLSEADDFKQKVVQRGVGDSFVTAEYNGTRVLLSDVIRILSSKGFL